MKHTLLKTTAVLAVAALSTEAFAAPEIHGRLVLAAVANDNETKTTDLSQATPTVTKSSSSRATMEGTSRLRFSGKEKINDKVDLEYWLDYNIYLDNYTEGKNFSSRNTYLGLKHKDYGTVRFGRLYTVDDNIDYADEGFYFSSGTPWSYAGERTNNTIQYESPGFGPNKKVSTTLHYAMDEGEKSTDLVAANVFYDGDKLKLGASHVRKSNFNSTRLMASYDVNDKWKFATLAQQADYNTSNNELAVLTSGVYHYDKTLDLYGQVGFADSYEGHKDGEKLVAGVGAIKTLKKESGKRVRAYGSLNYTDTTSYKGTIKSQTDGFAVETGLRYDF